MQPAAHRLISECASDCPVQDLPVWDRKLLVEFQPEVDLGTLAQAWEPLAAPLDNTVSRVYTFPQRSRLT